MRAGPLIEYLAHLPDMPLQVALFFDRPDDQRDLRQPLAQHTLAAGDVDDPRILFLLANGVLDLQLGEDAE